MTPAEEWARCRPWIEAALATSPGLETIEDVEQRIDSGECQVWFGRTSCLVTTIETHPNGKVLNVLYGGGNLSEMMDDMEPNLCAFARDIGCNAIMGLGRRGWDRICSKHGYQFAWVAMIKRLEPLDGR